MQHNTSISTAQAHHQAGRLPEAQAAYEDYLQSHPDDAGVLMLLGTLYAQRGQSTAAADTLQRALQLQPDLAEAHLNLGNLCLQQGQLQQAEQHFTQVLAQHPGQAQAEYGYGKALQARQQWPAAAEHFRAALQQQPAFGEALFGLGAVLAQLGQLDEASDCLSRCAELHPNVPDILCVLATVQEQQNDNDAAMASLRKAIALAPGQSSSYWKLGDFQQRIGLGIDALESYRRAVTVNPQDQHAQARYGAALLMTGPPEKLELLQELHTDHVYADADEARQKALQLATHYAYSDAGASQALIDLFTEFDPAQLYPDAWWQTRLQGFGLPQAGHDRIVRGIMSAIFSWSIPTREPQQMIADFVGGSRLNSLGAGTGYWEYLLHRHFDIPVAATDIMLGHRFIDVQAGDYAGAALDGDDVLFLSWIPRGENSANQVLDRMVAGQKLILIGQSGGDEANQICATHDFYARIESDFELLGSRPLVRFNGFQDSVYLYRLRTAG